jgi:acyl-CoA thioesterase
MGSIFNMETRESHLADLRDADAAMMPFGHTLGFRVERVTAGEAMVVIECQRELHNIFGYIHGGAIFSIADTAIGLAHVASLNNRETGTTVESKINFLRPALGGTLRAHARCVKQGRSLSLFECDVSDEQNRLIARTSATMMSLADQRSEGRSRLYTVAHRSESDALHKEST